MPKLKESLTGVFYNNILMIVDRLTKYIYLMSYLEAFNAEDLAYIFVKTIMAQHGTPDEIISDRDKLFISQF